MADFAGEPALSKTTGLAKWFIPGRVIAILFAIGALAYPAFAQITPMELWLKFIGAVTLLSATKLRFAMFYTLCGYIAHSLGSWIDKKTHWTRFAFGVGWIFLFSFAVNWYVPLVKHKVPDLGIWFHSIRPMADLLGFAMPFGIIGMAVVGLGERLENIGSFGKELFSENTWHYIKEKIKLYFAKDGLFKLVLIFWAPIVHFTYYDIGSTAAMIGISASIMPVIMSIAAIFMVQRPGEELTNIPWLNWLLKHSYYLPSAIVSALAASSVIKWQFFHGTPDLNLFSAVLTSIIAYTVWYIIYTVTTAGTNGTVTTSQVVTPVSGSETIDARPAESEAESDTAIASAKGTPAQPADTADEFKEAFEEFESHIERRVPGEPEVFTVESPAISTFINPDTGKTIKAVIAVNENTHAEVFILDVPQEEVQSGNKIYARSVYADSFFDGRRLYRYVSKERVELFNSLCQAYRDKQTIEVVTIKEQNGVFVARYGTAEHFIECFIPGVADLDIGSTVGCSIVELKGPIRHPRVKLKLAPAAVLSEVPPSETINARAARYGAESATLKKSL